MHCLVSVLGASNLAFFIIKESAQGQNKNKKTHKAMLINSEGDRKYFDGNERCLEKALVKMRKYIHTRLVGRQS